MRDSCAVILAAGDGKRMKSRQPKVLCELLFKPMLFWVTDAVKDAGIDKICTVVSDDGRVAQRLPEDAARAVQEERLGTGHAVSCAAGYIEEAAENVLVLCGDAPLISSELIKESGRLHQETGAAVTVIAALAEDPSGYGRVVCEGGEVKRITEHKDADEKTREIHLINTGAYWFGRGFLLSALKELSREGNAAGEYYLTDTVEEAVRRGLKVSCYTAENWRETLGANSRGELAELSETARDMVISRLRAKGVDIPAKDGVMISPDAEIGCDTQILPGCIIKGKTVIGEGCVIGPNTLIEDCRIGSGCTVNSSQMYSSETGDNVRIGPFSQLRPGCIVGSDVKIGDFVELKASKVGDNTSLAHLTYLGDTDIGPGCNVGCGVVTANYDGTNKYRTKIGKDVFIGCNTNLIAPVEVEDGAYIAAGSTVKNNVPEHALSIPETKQRNVAGWALKRGLYGGRKK